MNKKNIVVLALVLGMCVCSARAGLLDAINKAADTVNRVTNAVEAVRAVPNGGKPAAAAPVVAPPPAETQTPAQSCKGEAEPKKPVKAVESSTKVSSRPALSEDEADDIANGQPISMDMDDLTARMKASSDYVLIDVRKPREFRSGHIKGAKNVPFDDVSNSMSMPCSDKDKPIYLYCLSGDRAIAAGQYLIKKGYKRVYNFGGIDDWTGKLIKGK